MNKRNGLLLLFAVVAAAQLAVPASMIIGRERTLREGRVFKFRTRPVDPEDAFRGRYVWLSLEPGAVEVPETGSWLHNQKAYAVLGQDTNGFAVVERLEHSRPAQVPAVQVRTLWFNDRTREVNIEWSGLDRYYMEEGKAPQAESAYRSHSLRTNRTCYVTVRVRGAEAAVENLFVDERPIRAWLRDHPEEKKSER